MKKGKYAFKLKVWLYQGSAAWHFVTLPKKDSEKIKKDFGQAARGWGSLPVVATINKTSWKTSIFPDKRAGAYLLPIKSDVRKKESVYSGDEVRIQIELGR